MRISDWSSDVCSSDLGERLGLGPAHAGLEARVVEQADHQAVVRGEIDCAAGVVEHRVGLGLEVVHEAEGLRRLLHQAALDGAGTAVGAQAHHREVYAAAVRPRSEEHTSELQSLMRTSYAVFCLKKKNI